MPNINPNFTSIATNLVELMDSLTDTGAEEDARVSLIAETLYEITLSAFEAGAGWGQAREQDDHFMSADRLNEVHGTQERAHAEWLSDWIKHGKAGT